MEVNRNCQKTVFESVCSLHGVRAPRLHSCIEGVLSNLAVRLLEYISHIFAPFDIYD